jgi:hypothetical protein
LNAVLRNKAIAGCGCIRENEKVTIHSARGMSESFHHAQPYPATDSRLCAPRLPDRGPGSVTHKALAAAGSFIWPTRWRGPALDCGGHDLLCAAAHSALARDAHRIAQGNLEHRVEWSSRDSFGVIARRAEPDCGAAARVRDTEAGRRQMEFQLSDAVLQSIFEPIIVTDGKGHVLK